MSSHTPSSRTVIEAASLGVLLRIPRWMDRGMPGRSLGRENEKAASSTTPENISKESEAAWGVKGSGE